MSKPQTKDGINYMMLGCTLRVLSIDDKIEKGDYIRPTTESPMYSESGGWDTTYKNDKWRGPMWHRVDEELTYWVGKTYRDYIKHMYEEDYGHYPIEEFIADEIVRVVE